MVSEGEMAPNFELLSDSGNKMSLKDFRGQKLILYFYPKDGTPGCTTEALEFKKLSEEFEKEGAIIIGISKDGVESHKKFKGKHDLPFTLLSDPEAKILEKYDVWKKKSLYGRTFMGTERTTFLIDEQGKVMKIYRKVKPKGHAETCLLDLKEDPKLFLP